MYLYILKLPSARRLILLNCEKLKCRLRGVCAFVVICYWIGRGEWSQCNVQFPHWPTASKSSWCETGLFPKPQNANECETQTIPISRRSSQCTMESRNTLINWFLYFACMWPAVGHALVCTVLTRVTVLKQLVDCGRSLFMHADFCIRWRSVRT